MNALGQWALWTALITATMGSWAATAGGALRRRSLVVAGARALHVTTVALAIATGVLARGLLGSDFSLRYVATFSSAVMPRAYRLGALWGGAPGSLLTWTLLLSLAASLALLVNRRALADRLAWFVPSVGFTVAVLALVTAFVADPFSPLAVEIRDGRGLDGVLQNRWMLLHPPLLMAGTAATLPLFGLTIAAIGVQRLDDSWRSAARVWTLLASTLLVAGVVAGMRWAYLEPGWGGAWAWDPVEVAGVVPLILLGVLLRALSRSGRHPAERAVLALFAFPVTLIGAWVARGDVLRTVHDFAQTPNALLFALIAALSVFVAAGSLVARRRWLTALAIDTQDESRSPTLASRLALVGGALCVAGVVALPFRKQFDTAVSAGDRYEARDVFGRPWVFTSQGASRYVRGNVFVNSVPFVLSRAGRRVGLVVAEERHFIDADEDDIGKPVMRTGVRIGLWQDVHVQLIDAGESAAIARIRFVPFASLLWLGGALVVCAGLAALPGALTSAFRVPADTQ